MGNFFKNIKNMLSGHGYTIGKLIRTHLVMTIFGLMVFIPFNTDDASMRAFLILGSVAATILFLFLIDVDMWYIGAEDKLRVDANRAKPTPLKGFLIGFMAELPSVIIGIAYAVISVLYTYYRAYPSGSFFAGAKIILWVINMLWNGMYLGTEYLCFGGGVPLFYLLIPLLPIIFSGVTYLLGFIDSPLLKPPSKERK